MGRMWTMPIQSGKVSHPCASVSIRRISYSWPHTHTHTHTHTRMHKHTHACTNTHIASAFVLVIARQLKFQQINTHSLNGKVILSTETTCLVAD